MMKSTSPIYINVKVQLLDLSIPQVMRSEEHTSELQSHA